MQKNATKAALVIVYSAGLILGAILIVGSLALGWASSWSVPVLGVLLLLASTVGIVVTMRRR